MYDVIGVQEEALSQLLLRNRDSRRGLGSTSTASRYALLDTGLWLAEVVGAVRSGAPGKVPIAPIWTFLKDSVF
jgi:hypothetical protein